MRGDLEYYYNIFRTPQELIDYFNDAHNDNTEIVSISYREEYKDYIAFYKIEQ